MERSFESKRRRSSEEFVAERMGQDGEAVPSRRQLVEANLDRIQAQRKPPAKWRSLGPRPLEQELSRRVTEVSGRAAGVAAHRDGRIVYMAAANGGVWRSDDGGRRWTSTMGGFDLDPQTHGVDTLSCGAIVLDPVDPDRVWVGTGEAATGRYFGVGPLVSVDGGKSWKVEPSDPPLEGKGSYELAVDPSATDRVLAATTAGLYRRSR